MEKIVGTYRHMKNENLDAYFQAVGVPFIPRKMMVVSSPTLEISQEGDYCIVKNSSMMRTTIQKFRLGEEFEEVMPNGSVLKSVTTMISDNTMITNSVIADSGVKTSRTYVFDDKSCELTLYHDKSQVSAKRFFVKVM